MEQKYSMFNKQKLLLTTIEMIMRKSPRENMELKDWMEVILRADNNGWLYYDFEGDKLSMVAIAFRVKEVKEEMNHDFPDSDEDEGRSLFVPLVVGYSKDKKRISRNIQNLFTMYNDIDNIGYLTRTEKIRVIERRDIDGKREENKNGSSEVLRRSRIQAGSK